MPDTIEFDGEEFLVATEAELLQFCNKVREVGGAELLPALLPSEPGNASQCLIARALNFDCSVDCTGPSFEDSFGAVRPRWQMQVDSRERYDAIEGFVGLGGVADDGYFEYRVNLPEEIGNAALLFDQHAAFTNYRRGY
jgi:hypothetical protein